MLLYSPPFLPENIAQFLLLPQFRWADWEVWLLVQAADYWWLRLRDVRELVNVVSCLFMMESGEEEIAMALLLVSGSVSLCSWQSQRENSPSLRCELSKCNDLSENVCVHITFVLCSWEHELHISLVTPCPAAPVQSSHPELANVQASQPWALVLPVAGVCLSVTLGQVQLSVVLHRRLLANLFSFLEATGDFTVKHKALFFLRQQR